MRISKMLVLGILITFIMITHDLINTRVFFSQFKCKLAETVENNRDSRTLVRSTANMDREMTKDLDQNELYLGGDQTKMRNSALDKGGGKEEMAASNDADVQDVNKGMYLQSHVKDKMPPKYQTVIFTTFYKRSDRDFIQKTVLQNWARLGDRVKPVLFNVNGTGPLTDMANDLGWDVILYNNVNNYSTPYLEGMYTVVMEAYDSQYYGYVNGDILWSNSFTKTMDLFEHYNLNKTLLIGQRANYEFKTESDDLWDPKIVGEIHPQFDLHILSAIDYFFVTRDFEFDILEVNVVIGRRAYDNYLVAQALKYKRRVVDATKGLHALHISTPELHHGSNNEDSDYNMDIIGKKYNYKNGYIDEANHVLLTDVSGELFLVKQERQMSFLERLTQGFGGTSRSNRRRKKGGKVLQGNPPLNKQRPKSGGYKLPKL